MRRRTVLRGLVLGPLAGSVAGCADLARLTGLGDLTRVAVSWSAVELAAFRQVLGDRADGCALIPLGDDISAALGAGTTMRPDVVALPKPRLVGQNRDRLATLPGGVWHEEYGGISPDPRLAVPFKLAHASVVWYRPSVFERHGLRPPRSWAEWQDLNDALTAAGIAPLALGGADGWLLAQFFENVLLRRSPEVYRAVRDAVPGAWADAAVGAAFGLVARMWGRPGAIRGGPSWALTAQFPDAVLEVFRYGRAAMVPAPDFAESVIRRYAGLDDADTFTFPGPAGAPLVISGDLLVLAADARPEAVELVRYLAEPDAPVPWIRDTGGFIAANPETDRAHYSPVLLRLVDELRTAEVEFSLSDQVPEGATLHEVMHDLLRALADDVPPARAAATAADTMARIRP